MVVNRNSWHHTFKSHIHRVFLYKLTFITFMLQLSRIIYLFSSNMHDASLSLSIHTTCARLMLNLVHMLTLFSRRLSVLFSFGDALYVLFFWYTTQVEPIFEKGVDQPSMDEARILLV